MKLSYSKRNGHERYKFMKKSMNPAAIERRKQTIEFLEAQLESGRKPYSKKKTYPINAEFITEERKKAPYAVKLNALDIQRIKEEINILKTRI